MFPESKGSSYTQDYSGKKNGWEITISLVYMPYMCVTQPACASPRGVMLIMHVIYQRHHASALIR